MKRYLILLLVLCLLPIVSSATVNAQGLQPPDQPENQIETVETYVKIAGGVIAGLVAVFGLPLTVVQFQRTRAEIRKLELEAEALEGNRRDAKLVWPSNVISIENSDNARVEILADPRFLGPLLLLLDFIIAWIVLSLFSYSLSSLPIASTLRDLILTLLAIILLVPIAREAYRVRRILRNGTDVATDNEP